jgi:uncharacterized protein
VVSCGSDRWAAANHGAGLAGLKARRINIAFRFSACIATGLGGSKIVPRLVLLDTNAILMPFQFRIHLDSELQRLLGSVDVAVPGPVLAELQVLAENDRTARAALQLAGKYRTIEAPGSADDALLDIAKAQGAVVVTLDQPLLDRLRKENLPRIFLRSRSHLAVEGL